jgi:tetratricopeptide (TPR) repeat protein
MTTIPEAFDIAIKHHQAGKLRAAEQICRQILQVDSHYVGAFHLLGLIAHQVGRNDRAIDYMIQALRLNPNYAEAHNNLGILLKNQGRLADAVMHYQQALALRPDYAEAHNNLGIALKEQGRLEEAIACYQQALRLRPNFAEAYNNLGNALKEQGRSEEVIANYQQALRLRLNYAEAFDNLGIALQEQGRSEEAITYFQQAIRLRPNYAESHLRLGVVLMQHGKLDEAVVSLQQAIRLQPEYADAHFNRALAWLLMGNFEQGWPEYEWRWKRRESRPPLFRQALWNGSPLEGRTILLYAEQGVGDTLQFVRYAPLVKQRGGLVIVVCQEVLLGLLATCPGVDRLVVYGSTLPDFDTHAPLLSLPGIFGTTLPTVPADVPYLYADPELREHWRQVLGPMQAFKIGIAWQGNPGHPNDRQRSVPLVSFEVLARLDGVRLLSLQKGPGTEQLAQVEERFSVVDLASQFQTFQDTAAVLENLDLVITVDSAVAHCAGALGVPVWVLLPFAPDWRWLLHREDSPWYPTLRLFRQTEPGKWERVFERVAGELKKMFAAATLA